MRNHESPERVWLEAPGAHQLSSLYKDELLAAMQDLMPRDGARLVVLGADVRELGEAERARLARRVGFVPANGGLMSSLNAWENISLPVAYHAPQKLAGALADVHALLDELGGIDHSLLGKLPEHMTLYERRLAAYSAGGAGKPGPAGGREPRRRARADQAPAHRALRRGLSRTLPRRHVCAV